MAIGASGRYGNHVMQHVEGEQGHVFVAALIQRQNGTDWIVRGQISQQRTVICTFVKVGHWKSKLQAVIRFKTFLSWIVSSHNQWMTAGATGRHGNHAVWRVEGETKDVLAHAPIQRQNGTDRIALGQISPQRAAIYKSVEVLDTFSWKYFLRAELVFFFFFF